MAKKVAFTFFVLFFSGFVFSQSNADFFFGLAPRRDSYTEPPAVDRSIIGIGAGFNYASYFGGSFGLFFGIGFDSLQVAGSQDDYGPLFEDVGASVSINDDRVLGLNGKVGFTFRSNPEKRTVLFSNIGARLSSDYEFITGTINSGYVSGGIFYPTKIDTNATVNSTNMGLVGDIGIRYKVLEKCSFLAGLSAFYTFYRKERFSIKTKYDSESTDFKEVDFYSYGFNPYIGFSRIN